MAATVEAIEYELPAHTESVDDLAAIFPNWPAEHILNKTGIHSRHIAGADECASDLGVAAAQRLLDRCVVSADAIDFLLFCTQTPDYLAPTTACLVQQRLGLSTGVGAFDINLGCSGYVYALGIAKGLVESGQARRLLLVTADTYSKLVNPLDRSVRALFGDGATATLIVDRAADSSDEPPIGPFLYGTDGRGAENLIVPSSGLRQPPSQTSGEAHADHHGNIRSAQDLFMDGRAVVEFTRREIPAAITQLCVQSGITLDDVDAVIPHQASALVLDGLREALGLDASRFVSCMRDTGNTVSSSIPIVLKRVLESGQLRPGSRVLLIGFGIGLSWGATLLRIPGDFVLESAASG